MYAGIVEGLPVGKLVNFVNQQIYQQVGKDW
jgi:hypothetical protein